MWARNMIFQRVPLLQIGTSSHRCGHYPCGVKQGAKSMTLRQSGKSSLMSWPVVPVRFYLLQAFGLKPAKVEKIDDYVPVWGFFS